MLLLMGVILCVWSIVMFYQSKNAVCANVKHNRYFHIKHPISGKSTPMVKGCLDIMFDVVVTTFSYWRALIVCQFVWESSKVKESSLYVIPINILHYFSLCEAELSFKHVICYFPIPHPLYFALLSGPHFDQMGSRQVFKLDLLRQGRQHCSANKT